MDFEEPKEQEVKGPTLLQKDVVIPRKGEAASDVKSQVGRDYIINYLKKYDTPKQAGDRVFVLRSGTGSGKSTLLPPALMYRGKRIGITEPTRLIVEEVPSLILQFNKQLKFGETIGYQTGLINKTPSKGLVFMTPGILLQHLLTMTAEHLMMRYSTIIIDEVHRHEIEIDLILSIMKNFIAKHWMNPHCPILILMSATLDPEKYTEYFDTDHVIEVRGSASHPIKEVWPDACIANLPLKIAEFQEQKGDTLIFLPTGKIIRDTKAALKDSHVVEVFSQLLEKSSPEFQALFHESKKPRIILSTEIAETGLTLPHLDSSVDAGFNFTVIWNPQYNCSMQFLGPISQASAIQRRGRVGRSKKGTWYPLYPKSVFQKMIPNKYPQIYTDDITGALLKFIIARTGATLADDGTVAVETKFTPQNIDLIHPPSQEAMMNAFEKLYTLGFIDVHWSPTALGVYATRIQQLKVEEIKLIFSSLFHKCDITSVIAIACIMQNGRAEYDAQKLQLPAVNDEFIEHLLVYETLIQKIRIMSAKKLSPNFIEQWCTENGLNYREWLKIIELVDETQFGLLKLGIYVDFNREPLIDQLRLDPQNAQKEIERIKYCILEAYRFNIATWDPNRQAYFLDYKFNQLAVRSSIVKGDTPPKNIITDMVSYRFNKGRMMFNANVVGIIDGLNWDRNFLY